MKITRILPLGLVALALTATGAAAHDGGKGFQLTGKAIAPPTLIDLGTPGPGPGDQQIISMNVFAGHVDLRPAVSHTRRPGH